MHAFVCVYVYICVYVCVCDCVHVCVREGEKNRGRRRGREGERDREKREERTREGCNAAKIAFKSRLDSGRGWEETASTCTSQRPIKAQLGKVYHD